MKFYLSVVTLALAMTLGSCKNNQKQNQTTETPTEQVKAQVITPEILMKDGAKLIDQNITIQGTITHVCKHGGKKCSIMGEDPEAFVQVMAGEKIGSFSAELIGTKILVKGIAKERRITKEDIAMQEEALKATSEKTENKEVKKHCSHSMHNVNKMTQWMTDNNKEYYPIYFVQGVSFETVK